MKIKILALTFLLFGSILAQTGKNIEVAKVGNIKITSDELVNRFELTPQLGQLLKGKEKEMLEDLLKTIIAEKLWSLEAINEGLDTTDAMKYTFRAIKKLYLRDALWKLEIASKVKVTDEDMKKAYEKAYKNRYFLFLHSESKDEIFSLYNKLKSGGDFYSILAKRPEFKRQEKPFELSFGKMDEGTENLLYSLKLNEITQPVKSPLGWFIFKFIKEDPVVLENDQQVRAFRKQVRDAVEERLTDKVYREFHRKFFSNIKVRAKGDIFKTLANHLYVELKRNKEEQKLKDGKQIDLLPDNIYRIEDKLGTDTVHSVFINFKKNPITVKQFLREFIFEGFFVNDLNKDLITAKLNSRVKRFIEMELIAREAERRGLENLPEVKSDLDMWRANYLAGLLKTKIVKETFLTEEETKEYFEKHNSKVALPKSVNIIEIFTTKLDVIDKVLNLLDEGADFKELAKEYTEREWTKAKGGEFGFFPVTMYGEIGRAASQMDIGEIYGPINVDNGWSIFKLIGKKDEVISTDKPFEKVKDDLRKKLSIDRYNKYTVEKTVELAKKYGIKINNEVLSSLKVTNLNMLVYRYFGFGGRLLAVPLNVPFTNWYKEWVKEQKDLL